MTSHAAAGSAAGYLHQMQLALLELWERTPEDPGVAVSVEAGDDIEVRDADDATMIFVQSKHHLGDATLTDRSPDLWKTVSVWIDLLGANGSDMPPRLALYTTAVCAEESAAALLRPQTLIGTARDSAEARTILEEVASEAPGNKATEAARSAFLELTDEQRAALVDAIDVFDAGAKIEDFDARLRKAVGMHAPDPDAVEEFAERLFGWWSGQVVFMLVGRITSVSGRELWSYVTELGDEVARRKLVVDEGLMASKPDSKEHETLILRAFVLQLQLVTDESTLFNIAVIDYWRARAQRVRWERHGDLTPDLMISYDRRLQEEWEHAHALMRARLESETDTEQRRAAGLDLYDELPQRSGARIRPDFHEPVITRGSLHALADQREIGWHPDFKVLLDGD
jgi:hypothetical protein